MPARITVSTMEDNMPLVQTWTNSVKKIKIFVGVINEDRETDRENPLQNTALANILENGAPSENIPPRPFMKPGLTAVRKEVLYFLKRGANALYDGKRAAALASLRGAGVKSVASIRRVMESNVPPPLAESTRKKRMRRGMRRMNTLIDTKQLWKSIGYRIQGL